MLECRTTEAARERAELLRATYVRRVASAAEAVRALQSRGVHAANSASAGGHPPGVGGPQGRLAVDWRIARVGLQVDLELEDDLDGRETDRAQATPRTKLGLAAAQTFL